MVPAVGAGLELSHLCDVFMVVESCRELDSQMFPLVEV